MDRAGIVYFAQLFRYAHICFEEMLTAVFGGLEPVFQAEDWALPLVHAEADYLGPTRLDDRLTVKLTVSRLGQTSVSFAFDVVGHDGRPRAKLEHVHVCVDLDGFDKRPLPPELVAGLTRLGLVSG